MAGGEREIVDPVDLCLADGRLNPAAIGWSRRPLHRANLSGWGRTKRWEYWAILTPRHAISLTAASADYAGLYGLYVVDRSTGAVTSTQVLAPLARGTRFAADPPGRAASGARQVSVRTRRLSIVTDQFASGGTAGTWVRARTADVGLDVVAARPDGHESLGTVIVWGPRRFQYSVKDVARPVEGRLLIRATSFPITPQTGVAILDHGRGRWPYRSAWNWAAGGSPGGGLGIQLGGSWSDASTSDPGTDAGRFSDNALVVEGRLHRLPGGLEWRYDRDDWMRPWTMHGDGVRVEFRPFHVHRTMVDLGLVAIRICRAFGEFTGAARADDGAWIDLDGVSGVAEEARHRW